MNYESTTMASDRAQLTGPEAAPRSRRRAVIVGIVIVLLVVIGAFWAFGRKGGDAPAAKGPPAAAATGALPKVTVVIPGRETVTRTVNGTGSLAARREMPVGVVG